MAYMLPLPLHHYGLPAAPSLLLYYVPGGLGIALTNQRAPSPFPVRKQTWWLSLLDHSSLTRAGFCFLLS